MTFIEQSYASRPYPRLSLLAVGLFIVGTNAFVIAGLLPAIARSLGTQPAEVSLSITYYSIVVAVAAPAISIAFPRLSRTRLMTAGLVLLAAGTLLSAAAPTLAVFTAGRIVAAFGGAALVPVATAAAATLVPPERRGRAIAFVAVGFTAASAFGAPLGTAIAAVSSWRLPLFALAAMAAALAVAVAVLVRDIPVGEPVGLRRRFSTLTNPRLVAGIIATLLVICGFNVVYIFSSSVTRAATAGSGAVLAVLLLIFGVAGIIGNVLAGRLTDRLGGRLVAGVFLGVQIVSLATLPTVASSFVGSAIVFAVWGIAANGSLLPIQHRLIEVDPATAGVALSWYSTAMYAGIALAPPLGNAALAIAGPELVPLFGAIAVALALIVFQLSWMTRRIGPVPSAVNRA